MAKDWNRFTFLLVDDDGRPVRGDDGEMKTEVMTATQAQMRNITLMRCPASGQRWRRAGMADYREAK
jgi:hypothetical protein